ncbi:MAG: selenium cofactor biosynthesis protein YqeC [Ruminococcus sp.]|nr:selenium cofactor biosynthesis protein YqeC [Ruminococcus sp.]
MSKKRIIAVVGSGGKTTYIKSEAKKYCAQGLKVFVTTSTHMALEKDMIVSDDANEIIRVMKEKGYVIAGLRHGEKIQGLSKETYKKVCEHADVVLVEADGSKHLPIKFPAEYEPVIYENVTEIVVVCGLHALGKPLKEVAHRLELVKACLNREKGDMAGSCVVENYICDDTIVKAYHVQKLVEKGYLEPMKEMHWDKKIEVKATHDDSLYQRVVAKLIENRIDVSLVKEEWFHTQPEIVICGGGHVSYELVKMASCLDFHIKVIDDREEFANKERFQLADEVVCDSFKNLKRHMVKDAYYVVITRGHKDDFDCVSTILGESYQYLGMIGSKSKVKATFDHLREVGVSEELIETIHAPIGLKIGAKTPAEIAVSILAEIIQVKNEKSVSFVSRELSGVKEPGVLCVIIEKTGSAPRGEGSMMYVTDEKIIDTIGGGAIEFAAIKDARKVKEATVKEYSLSNSDASDIGMICGGTNKVLFVPL